MKLIVNPHKIEIEKTPVNEKEIDITKVQFEFAEEITPNYVKDAYFTYNGTTYKVLINNNKCSIPYEVLNKQGMVEIGVVAYLVEDETEIKRYNPSPVYISTLVGSLKDQYENTEPITPSDKEQIEQLLQNGLNDIEEAIDRASNLDVDAEKIDKTTTITITKQDGTQEQTYVEDGIDGQDGVSLENMVIDNRDLKVTYGGETDNLGQVVPNIQVGTTTTVLPSADARVVNVGTDLNPILNFEIPKGDAGAIKIRIVNELPETGSEDTFYLVPKQESETQDMYDEYVWINNTWELVGEKQIEVDLSDYYTKSETNTLLSNKVGTTDYATTTQAGVILASDTYNTAVLSTNGSLYAKNNDYATYQTKGNGAIIGKGTLENVITGKGLVSNTDYASDNTGGTIKTYSNYATTIVTNGILGALTKQYNAYLEAGNSMFIGKGTLENVITGKGLVSNTDYATSSTGGVIKVQNSYGTTTYNGFLTGNSRTYANYTTDSNALIICKGTLENVITGKDLTTKSYVDGLVGDIATTLDTIQGEVI